MNRLSMPCYLCGGIVVDLQCSRCKNVWDNANRFAGRGYEYRQAQTAVLIADGGNLIELYQLQIQAKKYLEMIRVQPYNLAIDAVIDGNVIKFQNDTEMADYITKIMNRSADGKRTTQTT